MDFTRPYQSRGIKMARKKTHKKTKKPAVKKEASDWTKIKVTQGMWNAVFVVVAAILITGLVAGFASLLTSLPKQQLAVPQKQTASKPIGEVASDTVDFITQFMVPAGVDVKVVSSNELSGVYHLDLRLSKGNNTINAESYVTKDGKYLFVKGIDMDKARAQATPSPKAAAAFDAPNTDKPTVKFFVMAFCPFGQQCEKGLEPVFQLLGNSVSWEPHYVIYDHYQGGSPDYCLANGTLCSMHGVAEVNEDARQICISKNYDAATLWKYLKYVYTSCSRQTIGTCWKDAAASAGIDTSAVESCVSEHGIQYLQEEHALDKQYGVRGSPTVFINGKQYNGGRAPENYKQAICSGFNSPPKGCSESIGAATASASGSCN